MNWREFKRQPEGFKGFKPAEAPPLKPLKPLKPAEAELKSPAPATEAELFDMIRQRVEELDAAGSWEGYRQRLTPEAWQSIKTNEARIDTTYGEGNREELAAALMEYREACMQAQRPTERKDQQ